MPPQVSPLAPLSQVTVGKPSRQENDLVNSSARSEDLKRSDNHVDTERSVDTAQSGIAFTLLYKYGKQSLVE